MPKKKPKKGKPNVNPALEGLDIQINEFGEIVTTYDIQKINKFLNENVEDKKLKERDDYEELSAGNFKGGVKSDEEEFLNLEEEDESDDLPFVEDDEDEKKKD